MNKLSLGPLALCLVAHHAAGQSHFVMPSSATLNDQNGAWQLAAPGREHRFQVILGSQMAASFVNRPLLALELRRDSDDEALVADTITVDLTLSSGGLNPNDALPTFAYNHGPFPVQVFNGQLTLPASQPLPTGQSADWSAQHVLRIPFASGFTHTSGNIVIDLTIRSGSAFQGMRWDVDAAIQPEPDLSQRVGSPCGSTGIAGEPWSGLDGESMVPGATVRFFGLGTPHGLGMILFGQPSANLLNLGTFGGQPNCWIHLSNIVNSQVVVFGPPIESTQPAWGGSSIVPLQLPASSTVVGVTLATQWVDLNQSIATSSAITWTIANSSRPHNTAFVSAETSAGLTPTSGSVHFSIVPVVRLEAQ